METEPITRAGLGTESVPRAAQLPEGSWVRLYDLLFSLHGLGPHYALVQTQRSTATNYPMPMSTALQIGGLTPTTAPLTTRSISPGCWRSALARSR